jgi:hypothetical protein
MFSSINAGLRQSQHSSLIGLNTATTAPLGDKLVVRLEMAHGDFRLDHVFGVCWSRGKTRQTSGQFCSYINGCKLIAES